jgi:hypothetical protein
VVALTPLGGTATVPGLRLPDAPSVSSSFSEASFSEGDA